MNNHLKITNVVGARPNFPKIGPLMREMGRHPEIEPLLIHTGQHYDDKLNDIFFRQMGIPLPDVNLEVGSGSHAVQTAEILRLVEPVLIDQEPDLVLVVGDVNSTIAVSLAAVKLGMSVAHVEAGLRSFDRSMPEEINRILTDALAGYLFVTEEEAIGNLLREGRPRESIFFVGNVMIDSLRYFLSLAQQSRIGEELGLVRDSSWLDFAVVTLHRPSNVDFADKFGGILSALDSIAAELPVIFPVHPRTKQQLQHGGIVHHPNLHFIEPVGYLDFLCLLSRAALVLTDSGGIQEETTALSVPCLTLRENTERPITITQGTNQLVGTDPEKIVMAARQSISSKRSARPLPPFWDGHAAERIVDTLCRVVPRKRSALGSLLGAR
jgi:UDP-N-acetylglucosamine 2-epimerase (non-hydrolysing)